MSELLKQIEDLTTLNAKIIETAQEHADENLRLRACLGWVESWVSHPVGSYSVSALDGLFGMTRDKIAALRAYQQSQPSPTTPNGTGQ